MPNLTCKSCPESCVYKIGGIAQHCLRKSLPKQQSYSYSDLAWATGSSVKRVKEAVAQSLQDTLRGVQFVVLANSNKAGNAPTCPYCGKVSGHACLNKIKCRKREALATSLLSQYPFNIPTLHLSIRDVWPILKALPTEEALKFVDAEDLELFTEKETK